MDGLNIFINLVWKTNPIQPFLRFVEQGSVEYTDLPLNVGDDLNLRIGSGYYCIGSDYERGKWLTCVANQTREHMKPIIRDNPHLHMELPGPIKEQINFLEKNGFDVPIFKERLVGEKNNQCSLCQGSEYFTCRMTCRGDICQPTSPQAKKLCEPANTSVYLTYVGDELKIGVSLGLPRRWVEQGSDLAVEIAKAPGLEARRIEHRAAEELDLKLQVRNETKLRTLNDLNLDLAKEHLNQKIDEISPIIQDVLQSCSGEHIQNPPIRSFKDVYGEFEFDGPIQVIDTITDNEFGGEIISIRGSLVIVRQGNYYFALNFKKLSSMTFIFLTRQAIMKKQSYLDDWF